MQNFPVRITNPEESRRLPGVWSDDSFLFKNEGKSSDSMLETSNRPVRFSELRKPLIRSSDCWHLSTKASGPVVEKLEQRRQ